MPNFLTAKTIKSELLASKIHYFEFQTDTPLISKPGQYINVKVADNRINCYSIATSDGPNKFSLLVDTTPGGPGSKFFENLKVDDKLVYLGPFGVFTLKLDDGASNLLFLGTGSGCSPLRCMVDAALKLENTKKPVYLYMGLNYSKNLFWYDYFQKLASIYPNFTFKVAIDTPDEDWKGPVGFITQFMTKDFPDASKCAAYLCGNKAMIADATEMLLSRNCPKERIYTEKY